MHYSRTLSAFSSRGSAGACSPELAFHDSRTLSAFSSRGFSASCLEQELFPVAASPVGEPEVHHRFACW
eukprot:416339-Amphidinium_carterae.1